jgi:hypothetical protein
MIFVTTAMPPLLAVPPLPSEQTGSLRCLRPPAVRSATGFAVRKGKAIYTTFGDELVVREVALSAKFWKLQVRSRFVCGSVAGGQAMLRLVFLRISI